MIKLFTIKFDRTLEKFDDTAFQEYIKDKDVLSVENHFFTCRETPYVLLILNCQFSDNTAAADLATVKPASRSRKSVVPSFLKESELPLYNHLKDWRNQFCKKQGIPPYIICNNDQLGKMVSLRPKTLADLAKIEGFGDVKAKKYGNDILNALAKLNENQPVQKLSENKSESNPEQQPIEINSNEPTEKN
ncbi:MAG: HRDC domain-containing protein [Candidatus Magnetomorum sp.]|nr:HRDC domain-containing protein [Candidatus Magnetomorum sp.]